MELQTVKTSELTGAALDWAVTKCERTLKRCNYGEPCFNAKSKRVYETEGLRQIGVNFAPSTTWAQGGEIIERESIGLLFDAGSACRKASWFATPDDQCTTTNYEGEHFDPAFMVDEESGIRGNTPLIAAMRCYVASKLGNCVNVPKELLVIK